MSIELKEQNEIEKLQEMIMSLELQLREKDKQNEKLKQSLRGI